MREQEILALRADQVVREQRGRNRSSASRSDAATARAENAGRGQRPRATQRGHAPAAGRPAPARGSTATPAGGRRVPRLRAAAARGTADCRRRARRTFARMRRRRREVRCGERSASSSVQRRKVDVVSAQPLQRRAPAAVERVAVRRATSARAPRAFAAIACASAATIIERDPVRPMQILDRDEHRRARGSRSRPDGSATSPSRALTRRVVHRLVQLAPRYRQRQVEQVGQERPSIGGAGHAARNCRSRGACSRSCAARRPAARPSSDATMSRIGSRPFAVPKSRTRPVVAGETPRPRRSAAIPPTSRDLPMPGSPRTIDERARVAGGACPHRPPRAARARRRDRRTDARRRRRRRPRRVPRSRQAASGAVDALEREPHRAAAQRASSATRVVHGLVEHDLACAGDFEEPRREIDRRRRSPCRRDAGRCRRRSRRPRRPQGRCARPAARPTTLATPRHRADNSRRRHGSARDRIVAVRNRRAEDRHHGVADVLVHAAAETLDDRVDGAEEPFQQLADVFGVRALRQPRVAAQVGEQHGDGPPLGFRRRRSLGRRGRRDLSQRPAAAAAEFLSQLVRESAARASDGQRRAALRAKTAAGAVIRAALRSHAPMRPRRHDRQT